MATSENTGQESAELVVAQAHVALVAAELDGVLGDVERCEPLGLAKLTLPDARRAAALFQDELSAPVVLPGQHLILQPSTPIEQVLAGLRVRFARRHSGWMPTLGKNRELVNGVGVPVMVAHVLPTSEPVPVSRPQDDGDPTAGAGVRVGVLDTSVFVPDGVDPAYLGLAELAESDRLRLQGGRLPEAWQGHGTFVAGLIHRYAPAAGIVARAVLTGTEASAMAWDVARAMVELPDVDVINLSLACVTADNQPPLVLQTAVDAVASRSVVVAAAGNYLTTDGPERNTPPAWPAALDQVVAVGSTGPDGTRSQFSPAEPWVSDLERGEQVVSTYLSGKVRGSGGDPLDEFAGYARWSGTSFAAAALTGRIAAAGGVRPPHE